MDRRPLDVKSWRKDRTDAYKLARIAERLGNYAIKSAQAGNVSSAFGESSRAVHYANLALNVSERLERLER